jgi:hypothetical protein
MGTKLRSITIRVEHELWDRVVARAREEAVAEFRHADVAGASHA